MTIITAHIPAKTVKGQTNKPSPRQQLAYALRRKEYRGCRGQVSHHGMSLSIQLFAEDTPANRERFPHARMNQQGSLLVADFDLDHRQ